MKILRSALALALTLALAACEKLPQAKRLQTTNEIEMDLLMVRVSEKNALALLPRLRDARQSAAATAEIIKSIGAGEATLIAWQILTNKSGQRAVVEQIDEFRYATEFDPPGSAKVTEKPVAEESTAGPLTTEPPPKPTTVKTTESVSEPVPANFETRNIGVTFEVESVIAANGRTIELSLVPQHVRLRAMRKVTVEGPQEGRKVVVEQPEFVTHKVTTSLSVEDGDYTLLGVFNVIDMPGQTELFILHTRIKRIEVPSSEPPPAAPPAGGPGAMGSGAGYPATNLGGE